MLFEEIFSNGAMTVQRDRLRLPVQINLEKPIAFSIKFPCMEICRSVSCSRWKFLFIVNVHYKIEETQSVVNKIYLKEGSRSTGCCCIDAGWTRGHMFMYTHSM